MQYNHISQYTGESDDNHKPIFLGDLLEIKINDRNTGKVIAEKIVPVKFESGRFGVWWGFRKEFTNLNGFCSNTMLVIGNRWDNPELMEG